MREKKYCEYEPDTLKVSAKNIHWMRIFQWHWYISYNQKNLKRKPNPKNAYYEIKEYVNPNPKKIVLWNKGKLQATLINLSTASKSIKCIT